VSLDEFMENEQLQRRSIDESYGLAEYDVTDIERNIGDLKAELTRNQRRKYQNAERGY